LHAETLVQYREAHPPDLLDRLRINVRIKKVVARAWESLGRRWARRPGSPSPGPAAPPGGWEECRRGVGG